MFAQAAHFRATRLQSMSSAPTLFSRQGDDEKKDTFMDAKSEVRWREESLKINIKMGAKALICWTLMLLGSRASFYFNTPDCFSRQSQHSLAGVVEYSVLIASLAPLLFSLRKQITLVYLPVVVFHFGYLLAVNLPPFAYTCKELDDLMKCDTAREEYYLNYRLLLNEHRDCTLQGHTSQQMCMTWLLIMPRLLPRKWMMNCVWFWIFFCYLPVSLYHLKVRVLQDGSPETIDFLSGHRHSGIFGETYFFEDHDIIISVALLCITNAIAVGKKFYLDKSQQHKFLYDLKMRGASEKMFNILHYMVPVHVIGRMLRSDGEAIAEPIDKASILFIMICDFEQYTRSYSPEELLLFLNEQFTTMDEICQLHGVTKIETVGEEYVAAVGVIPKDKAEGEGPGGHQVILGRLLKAAWSILKCQRDDVKFKMGMHTGPVVAGVIGHKLPRFRLFGDTINTSARMMQKGLPGELQFGEDTKAELPDCAIPRSRGPIEMKGKGLINTYFLDKITEPKKRATTSADNASGESSVTSVASSGMKRRKSLAACLINEQAQAVFEAGSIDVDTNEERRQRGSASSVSSSDIPPRRGFEAMTEVELTPMSKESGQSSQMQSPLLNSDDEAEKPSARLTKVSSRSAASSSEPRIYANDKDQAAVQKEDTLKEEDPEFEKVLQEIKDAELNKIRKETKWWYMGIDKEHFTKDMEANWYKWYHESTICKKLDIRLDKQALAISVITLMDTLAMVYWSIVVDTYRWGAEMRFPIFLICRTTVFFIVMSWRVVAGFNHWIEGAPKQVQTRVLLSYILIAALMYASYDAMTECGSKDPENMPERRTSYGSLVFIPIYFSIITSFQLLFLPSLGFILLSAVLMLLNFLDGIPSISSNSALFFSFQGKVLFIVSSAMNAYLAHEAENTSRARFKAKHTMDSTCNRIEVILNTLMPPNVVEEIRNLDANAEPPSHTYNAAMIAQSDLCGFTKLAATRTAQEVVTFMGELFGLFDDLTDKYGIYKVETIGDAYIAGQAECPLTEKNRPVSVVLFGLDMVRKTHEWARGMGENVSCRVGVHFGKCIGGIVGTEMQRYHLFGDLMTCLEVLESTAPEGKVQISSAAKEACESQMREERLPMEAMMFEPRMEPNLQTSKGEVHEFEEIGGISYTVRTYAQLRSLIKT